MCLKPWISVKVNLTFAELDLFKWIETPTVCSKDGSTNPIQTTKQISGEPSYDQVMFYAISCFFFVKRTCFCSRTEGAWALNFSACLRAFAPELPVLDLVEHETVSWILRIFSTWISRVWQNTHLEKSSPQHLSNMDFWSPNYDWVLCVELLRLQKFWNTYMQIRWS